MYCDVYKAICAATMNKMIRICGNQYVIGKNIPSNQMTGLATCVVFSVSGGAVVLNLSATQKFSCGGTIQFVYGPFF